MTEIFIAIGTHTIVMLAGMLVGIRIGQRRKVAAHFDNIIERQMAEIAAEAAWKDHDERANA